MITLHDKDIQIVYNEKRGASKTKSEPASEETTDATIAVIPSIPDGGLRAWLVVLSSHCATFATFGMINAWGVFQDYYERTLLSEESPSTIAWIGSIQYALVFVVGIPVGRMFDRGYLRLPVGLASACLITFTFLVAECTEFWQFLLCQGFAVGLACGFIMGNSMSVISHWFTSKKSFAFAINSCGASVGGMIFPIATRKLIPIVGFPWTMRILGFMQVALLAVTNIFIKRNLPPKAHLPPLSLRSFKNLAFALYCLGGFIFFLGLYTCLTYINVSAENAGIDSEFAFYLVAIANAASTLGRTTAGFTADRLGPLTTLTPPTLVASAVTYAWPFARTKASLTAVAVLYGATSGVFTGIFGTPPMDMGPVQEYGTRLGLYLTCISFGALAGPPISGAINASTGSFVPVGIFAGTTMTVSVAIMLMARHAQLHSLWGKA